MDGLVIVDKQGGMTSHDVVARMRKLAGTRRIGHAGTLDPMATGVLVLGVGRATRLLSYLSGGEKAYRATIRLGQSTVTDDAEGEITASPGAAELDRQAVQAVLQAFAGDIEQVPSSVSAIKVGGVRSYARVRAGEPVTLAARRVTVYRLHMIDATPVEVDGPDGPIMVFDVLVELACSSGTYVRAIARDAGERLGVGGHLTTLRRLAVGPFTEDDALTLAELAELAAPVRLDLAQAAERIFTRRDVDGAAARVLSHGGPLPAVGIDGPYAVFDHAGRVLAVVSERGGAARAEVVLAPAGTG